MTDLILHHYPLSPFSEKIRRILAFKGLDWRSVRAPAVMPKPDLVALTGGYRKIPVLQIANHVYCDTSLIARVLDRIAPSPPLFDEPMAAAVAEWADTALFEVAVVVGMRPTRFDDLPVLLTSEELSKITEDRRAMRLDARRFPPPERAARAHLAAYLTSIDEGLRERPFVLGDSASIADFSVYHCLWFLERLAPEPLAPFARVRAHMERIAAIAGRTPTDIDASEALAVAKNGSGRWNPDPPSPDGGGPAIGDRVVVRAVDYGRDPVTGVLVEAGAGEFAVKREDDRAGTVIVHFPKIGYGMEPG